MTGKFVFNTTNHSKVIGPAPYRRPLLRFTAIYGYIPTDGNEDQQYITRIEGCLAYIRHDKPSWHFPRCKNFTFHTTTPRITEGIMKALEKQGVIKLLYEWHNNEVSVTIPIQIPEVGEYVEE